MNKKTKERLFFSIFAFVVASFLFVAPYVILPKIYAGRGQWLQTAPPNATFLELWEIDTFEGGNASRARFLEKTAYMYQEKTLSTFVIVRSVDLEQAKMMLENGTRPDLISFGIGAGDMILSLLSEINTDLNVRTDLQAGGIKEGKIMAVPWCFGGYVLCAKGEVDLSAKNLKQLAEESELKVLGTGQNYNLPQKVLNSEEYALLDNVERTQYQAYESFLRENEFQVLLGTQRDFYRLNNKVSLGVIDQMTYEYKSNYTDLIQYLAISTNVTENIIPATKFIKFVTQPHIQKKLTSIGMFSVDGQSIYSNEYAEFEKALQNKLQVMNVFTSNVYLKEQQNKEATNE